MWVLNVWSTWVDMWSLIRIACSTADKHVVHSNMSLIHRAPYGNTALYCRAQGSLFIVETILCYSVNIVVFDLNCWISIVRLRDASGAENPNPCSAASCCAHLLNIRGRFLFPSLLNANDTLRFYPVERLKKSHNLTQEFVCPERELRVRTKSTSWFDLSR